MRDAQFVLNVMTFLLLIVFVSTFLPLFHYLPITVTVCIIFVSDEKTEFSICENKDADQLCSNCTADQHFVNDIQIVLFICFVNPKFQASGRFL